MSNLAEICLNEAHITHRATVFRQPPTTTFAVTFDAVNHDDGADLINNLTHHDITIELYEPALDLASRTALESAMDNHNIKWERDDTTWLTTEQLYMTVYTFTYIEKGGHDNV